MALRVPDCFPLVSIRKSFPPRVFEIYSAELAEESFSIKSTLDEDKLTGKEVEN